MLFLSVATLLSALSVAILTAAVVRLSLRIGLVDVPVARSAHSRVQPLGGGVALALPFFVLCVYELDTGSLTFGVPTLCACLGVFLLGLWDDFSPLSLRVRLPLQFLAAALVVQGLSLPAVDFMLFRLEIPWLLMGLAVFSQIWLSNLVNFMDGIDGLVASELLFCTIACFVLIAYGDSASDGAAERGSVLLFCGVLGGSALGFLLWNWSPARLFMGDAGSVFCGFVIGLLALKTHEMGLLSVWSWLLLLGAFVADTAVTLVRRFLRGKALSEGHSEHAYQHLSRRWGSHSLVVLLVLGVNSVVLFPLAWFAGIYPQCGVVFAIAGIGPLAIAAAYCGAGQSIEAK